LSRFSSNYPFATSSKPEIVVRVSTDRAIFHSARVVGFIETCREKLEQKEASGIKQSTIKNIYRRNE